ncbi:MAG TPA: hypothetical protein VF708_05040 [Pyrinomonadaceae bacterium]|jgi:hypothetical protein
MYAVQKPGKNLFVIRGKGLDKDALSQRLAPLGEVEEVGGSGGMFVLRVNRDFSNPKAAWQHAHEALGKKGIIQPVLLDENGSEQYPTGEIGIRFHTTLSDAQLKRFATSHGLRFCHRNEYMPQQAVFEPLRPGERYLPELLKELAGEKDVKLVWADTLARFQRI